MARKLEVQIVGDAASLEHALGKASKATQDTHHHLSLLGEAGAFFAGGEAFGAVKDVLAESVKAAVEEQTAQAGLEQALKNTHQSVKAMSPALEEASAASRKLGFTDQDTEKALTKLEIATGSTKQSITDLSTVQDIARVKHLDLSTASQMLAQAMTGSQRAAKQLGIAVPATTEAVHALRDAGWDNSTALGRQKLAMAALEDKMATGKDVIAAVTDKVHGQAKAYADTAAGGMAQFHAQVEHIQAGIGTALLPVMQGALTWVTVHWPEISAVFRVVGEVIRAVFESVVVPAVRLLISVGEQVVSWTQTHWPEISHVVKTVMDDVHAIIKTVTDAAETLWRTFGGTLTTIARNDIGVLKGIFDGLFTSIKGVFNLIDDLIHGRWSQIWGDAKQIVSGVLTGIEAVIKGAVGNIEAVASALGSAFVNGMKAGLSALGGALEAMVKAPLNALISAWNALGIPSVHIGFDTHIPGVGKIGFDTPAVSLPDLPHLAAGGIVTSPTLAMIGEAGPEAVIPLGRGGGLAGDLVVRVFLDGRELMGSIQRHAITDLMGGGYGVPGKTTLPNGRTV